MSNLLVLLAPHYQVFDPVECRPYCLNYTNSDGELAATRFTYNAKGLCDTAYYQNITGSRSSRNFHEFDKAGRMVRKYREYNDGETSTEWFTYGEDGHLAEERFENSKGVRGTTRYRYDPDGRLTGMACDAFKGWLKGEISFTFDEQGKRTAGRIRREGSVLGSIEYQYDRHGNLIREHWDFGGDWSQTFLHVYEPIHPGKG